MAEVNFTEQSLRDLEDIANYIAADSTHYANLQIHKIDQRTKILEQFPFLGKIVPELKQKTVRELIESNYRIIYFVVNKDLIHIITVHHSRRKLKVSQLRKRKRLK